MIELLRLRLAVWRLDLRCFRHDIPFHVAARLPRSIALQAYIRVMGEAWAKAGNKEPNEITFEEACDRWKDGQPS